MEKIPELEQFMGIITRDDVGDMKPNAEGFYKALRILGLQADEVLSIGDQASDIIAGKKAGLRSVAVAGDFTQIMAAHLKDYNLDFLIKDLQSLPYLLKFIRDCLIADIKTTAELLDLPVYPQTNDALLLTDSHNPSVFQL